MFLALNSPYNRHHEIFRKQSDGVFNGIKESAFLNKQLGQILDSWSNLPSKDKGRIRETLLKLSIYRTLVDHYGGFVNEIVNLGGNKIRLINNVIKIEKDKEAKVVLNNSCVSIPDSLDNSENILKEILKEVNDLLNLFQAI
ncbi:hypothetical protein [Acidianus sp. HS-5]|uniref:hypothetical protein n=1 Tax=Acidianus sp. HS-5 TaxID=2886040 RepID=UPI001F4628FD|nr:hypothetical protein [Acidianus sp. HS-5]BDC18590.1 hypothetical protein HS5_14800 [Acidianus sp. HS-5]